ncbi:MAG: hypothetical protein SGARI_004894 [Bacillariaceae sp.]
MAAISKASIKARPGGKRRSFLGFLTTFLLVVAIFNFFMNDTGLSLEQVEQSLVGGVGSSSKGGVVTDSSNSVAASNGGGNSDGNTDPFYPKEVSTRQLAYLFHHTPNDRAGKEGHIILDMLMGHAYSFHQRRIYGGSCGGGNDVGRDPERKLLKTIGLDGILNFACPGDYKNKIRQKEIPSKSYVQDGIRALTPEYIDLLKSVVKYPERTDNTYTIVVHIRRDKHTPCRKQYQDWDPYLPNKHYQALIDKNMKPNAKVVIYSQENSYESLDEFREKGYEMHVEEAIEDVWRAAMTSDVFIMSRSDFSLVPAMLTKATVVYTPYWEKPLRGWNVVGKDVMAQTKEELDRLKETCPKVESKMDKLRKRLGKH